MRRWVARRRSARTVPLVTLALVLDGSGFPKRCEVFAGNASEPATLAQMVGKLVDKHASECAPTVVLDAGLATQDNIAWLVEHHYRYVVVSRKRHREFDPDQAVRVKDDGPLRVEVQRVLNEDTGEVELYCHSTGRENKGTWHRQPLRPAFRGGAQPSCTGA